MVTYDRPVPASLHVHLANGETWEATDEDLARFGLARRHAIYAAFRTEVLNALDAESLLPGDITDTALNPIRELAEVVCVYPGEAVSDATRRAVADLERRLQTTAGESRPRG